MVMLSSEGEIVASLNRLIVTDYDAIEAYQAAISRISRGEDQATLRSFADDHRRHIAKLAELVRQSEGSPVDHADLRRLVTKGKVVIGGFMGDDAVLGAMYSNESETNEAYARASASRLFSRPVRLVLARFLDDEVRHREWLERRITMTPKGESVLPCM
ncbi:DUF2383 domain-containing protein [Pendulispora albinea]|uniref:PA2169 family four-helix-bundle protein n=1 Tax=Pendulispora albinea TaxID=2741071 RepID=A0ABZ2M3C6_9BACT